MLEFLFAWRLYAWLSDRFDIGRASRLRVLTISTNRERGNVAINVRPGADTSIIMLIGFDHERTTNWGA